ncbi:MAG: hypothetical protein U9N59_03875 [Campylobacterota bacterium]|nr:hypothetical protein [Campylobacterota bacterium]
MIKKSLLTASILFGMSSYGQDIILENGWELLGATQDLNVSSFNGSCAQYLWKYDSNVDTKWKLHISNSSITNDSFLGFDTIFQGEGYWVKSSGSCNIPTDGTAYDTLKSNNVQDAINLLKALSPEASINSTLEDIKQTLNSNNQDENLMLAMIDISQILNSDEVKSLVTSDDGSIVNLDLLLSDMTSKLSVAQNATLAGGTDILHTLATKLKTASDTIGNSFTSVVRVMNYDGVSINYNDSLSIRASAVAAASALEYIASYTWGDKSYFEPMPATIDGKFNWNEKYSATTGAPSWLNIDSIPSTNIVEYTTASTNPISLLNNENFFKMTNQSRLTNSGVLLQEAVTLISSIDNTKLTDLEALSATDIADATKMKNSFESDGNFVDGYTTINIKNIFASSTYIDRDDFPKGFEYQNDVGTQVTLNSDLSKYDNGVLYFSHTWTSPDTSSECWSYSWGNYSMFDITQWQSTDNCSESPKTVDVYKYAMIEPTESFIPSASSLDEVIVYVENNTSTGSITLQEAINNN